MTIASGRPKLWPVIAYSVAAPVSMLMAYLYWPHATVARWIVLGSVAIISYGALARLRYYIINSRPYRRGSKPPRWEPDEYIFAICSALAIIVGVMLIGFGGPWRRPGIVITALAAFLGLCCLMGIIVKENELRKQR